MKKAKIDIKVNEFKCLIFEYCKKKLLEVREEGVADLSFLYYLNPTPNDHNLEWDMKHNLCSDPGDLSQPQP